jgi:hypothetical protein
MAQVWQVHETVLGIEINVGNVYSCFRRLRGPLARSRCPQSPLTSSFESPQHPDPSKTYPMNSDSLFLGLLDTPCPRGNLNRFVATVSRSWLADSKHNMVHYFKSSIWNICSWHSSASPFPVIVSENVEVAITLLSTIKSACLSKSC